MKPLIVLVLLGLAMPAAADPVPAARPATEPYVPPPPKAGHSYPECYCTDTDGNRVEVGHTACLRIGRRHVTSRCEKARNLVIWRHQTEGCAPGV